MGINLDLLTILKLLTFYWATLYNADRTTFPVELPWYTIPHSGPLKTYVIILVCLFLSQSFHSSSSSIAHVTKLEIQQRTRLSVIQQNI